MCLDLPRPKSELVKLLRQHHYGFVCLIAAGLDEVWVHRPSLSHVSTVQLSENATRTQPCYTHSPLEVAKFTRVHSTKGKSGQNYIRF